MAPESNCYPAERETEKASSKQKQKIRVLPTQHWTHISCSPMGSALAIHSKTSRPTRHKKSTHTNILMKLESHQISTTPSTSVIRQLDKGLDLSTVLIELFHFSLSLEFEIAFRKNIQRQVYSKEFVASRYCLTSFWHSLATTGWVLLEVLKSWMISLEAWLLVHFQWQVNSVPNTFLEHGPHKQRFSLGD